MKGLLQDEWNVVLVAFTSNASGESRKARSLLAQECTELIVLDCYAHQVCNIPTCKKIKLMHFSDQSYCQRLFQVCGSICTNDSCFLDSSKQSHYMDSQQEPTCCPHPRNVEIPDRDTKICHPCGHYTMDSALLRILPLAGPLVDFATNCCCRSPKGTSVAAGDHR